MAHKDPIDDPTGGDFNAALEESIQLVSGAQLDAAKNKRRAYKGVLTRLIGECADQRDVITKACPEGEEANWNRPLLLQRCDVLRTTKASLTRCFFKYSTFSDAVVELLSSGPAIKVTEAKQEFVDKKALVDTEIDNVNVIISKYYATQLARAPAAPAAATPTVKPEKELKPTKQLDVSDTVRDFERWLGEYKVYHSRSNFTHATVPEQRSFLSRCMSEALWRRATALETPAEASMPLDPDDLRSGLFYYILGCFSTSDPLLTKRTNIFSEKSGRQKCSGQGKHEAYPAFLARLNQRLHDADFETMTLAEVKQALILHFITDPELISKIMEQTNPSPSDQHTICMKYHEMQQKTSAIEGSLSQASISMARAVKTCVRCNANNHQRGAFCGPCGKDSKLPPNQQRRIKYFECSVCKYVGHHVTAACSNNNRNRVHIEKGEKASGQTQAPQPAPRTRGGARGGRRGPTAFSNKSRGFRGGAQAPARSVETKDSTNAYPVTDSGDESELESAYDTSVEDHTTISSVRVTLTPTRISTGTAGHFYRVDSPAPPRDVKPERHWRLKALARLRRARSRSHASHGQPTTDTGDEPGRHKTMTSSLMCLFGRFFAIIAYLSKAFMGLSLTMQSPLCPSSMINTVRIVPETVNARVSRVAPGYKQDMPIHTDPDFCPDLDNMNVTLGNALAEKRGKNRVRKDLSACPDTGAARSICSPTTANNLGARVKSREKVNIVAANGAGMINAGTATLRVTFQGKALDVDMLLTPDIGERCLIGLPDLKRFNVVTENFPCILPSNI